MNSKSHFIDVHRKRILEEGARSTETPGGESSSESQRLREGMAQLREMPDRIRTAPLEAREGKIMVNCPVCDKTVYANDESDLSNQLRTHVTDFHIFLRHIYETEQLVRS